MRLVPLLALAALLSSGCKPSPDAQMEKVLEQNGVKIPAAKGAVTPPGPHVMIVFVEPDQVAADYTTEVLVTASPVLLFKFDPARAPTEGADPKYRRTAADPVVVPLLNVATTYVSKGVTKVMIAAKDPPPAALYDQLRATLTAAGLTDQYRLARAGDGKIGGERLPAR